MISDMSMSSDWFIIFEGSGSTTGNRWLEEVCYLGKELWLLSLRDDPAWSFSEILVQEPEERSSANLAAWVIDMDTIDGDEAYPRVTELLEIATKVGADRCVVILNEFLHGRANDL